MYIISVQFYADLTTILSFCQIIVHCAIVGLFNVIYDSGRTVFVQFLLVVCYFCCVFPVNMAAAFTVHLIGPIKTILNFFYTLFDILLPFFSFFLFRSFFFFIIKNLTFNEPVYRYTSHAL